MIERHAGKGLATRLVIDLNVLTFQNNKNPGLNLAYVDVSVWKI